MNPQRRVRPVLQRLFEKVVIAPSGCWLFTGHVVGSGYGQISMGRKDEPDRPAHRVMFEALVGPIDDDLQLDHLCKVKVCVNPRHLEAVTARVNTLRSDSPAAINARRTHCKNGHPLSGLNLRIDYQGRRRCRPCHRAAQRRYMQRAG